MSEQPNKFEPLRASPIPSARHSSLEDTLSILPPSPSLLPTSLPDAPATSKTATSASINNHTEHTLAAAKAKEDEERRKWCAAYDAAQPSGRSLSVKDAESVEILRVFRESRPKKIKNEATDVGEAFGGKEQGKGKKGKGGFKRWLSKVGV